MKYTFIRNNYVYFGSERNKEDEGKEKKKNILYQM